MVPLIVIVALVVVALVVIIAVALRGRQPDTVDSFRRQIDALSPEARRSVVDQVQRIEQDEDDTDGP